MEIGLKDIVVMKKPHACGGDTFEIIRVGMDFKLNCCECQHIVMLPRQNALKVIKKIVWNGTG